MVSYVELAFSPCVAPSQDRSTPLAVPAEGWPQLPKIRATRSRLQEPKDPSCALGRGWRPLAVRRRWQRGFQLVIQSRPEETPLAAPASQYWRGSRRAPCELRSHWCVAPRYTQSHRTAQWLPVV